MVTKELRNRKFSFPSNLDWEEFKECMDEEEGLQVCLARFNGVEVTSKPPKEPEPQKNPIEPEDTTDTDDEAPSPY